jgi:hypothetical protein
MAAAAHYPAFARRVGIPVAVAKEYNHADHQKRMKADAKSAPAGKRRR